MFENSQVTSPVWFGTNRNKFDAKESFLNFGAFVFSSAKSGITGSNKFKCYIDIQEPYELRSDMWDMADVVRKSIEGGFDGFAITNPNSGISTYGVFMSEQIERI